MSKKNNVFTLRFPMDGKRSVLNGKIFNVLKNTDNKLAFKDVCTGNVLWFTTKIVIPVRETEDGIIFTTKSGTVYDLINVEKIIPTSKVTVATNINTDSEDEQIDENVESSKNEEVPFDPSDLSLSMFEILPKSNDGSSTVNTFFRHNKIIEWLTENEIKTVGDLINHIKEHGNFFDIIGKHLSNKTKIYEYDYNIINFIKSIGYDIHKSENFQEDRSWVVGEFKKLEFANSNNFSVISAIHEHKNINYGDGFDKTTFIFDRDVTEEEFLNFLKENNFRIHKAEGWWDDHSKIEGNDKCWVYTWVLAYTD